MSKHRVSRFVSQLFFYELQLKKESYQEYLQADMLWAQ